MDDHRRLEGCPACREYLAGLVGYLESFHERTQPLSALSKVYARLDDFPANFDAGQVPCHRLPPQALTCAQPRPPMTTAANSAAP